VLIKTITDPNNVELLKNSNFDNNFGEALKTMLDKNFIQEALKSSKDNFYDSTNYDDYLSYF